MKSDNIAEIHIGYSAKVAKKFRIKINKSEDAYLSLLNSWNKDLLELQEEFKILLVNNANEVLGIQNLSKGSTNGVTVDVKLLFAVALKTCATGIIIAHNHPSGNLQPSESDRSLTKKIRESGKLLDIKLLDHLIVTKDNYFSLADNGMM